MADKPIFGRRNRVQTHETPAAAPNPAPAPEKRAKRPRSAGKTSPAATAPSLTELPPVTPHVPMPPRPTATTRLSDALPALAAKNTVAAVLDNVTGGTSDETAHLARVAELARAELAARELAKQALLEFTKRTVPGYDAGWVHEDVCRRLEQFVRDVLDKKSPRLIIAMPPRLGKSQIASICFPPWVLGNFPFLNFISCSYGQSLSEGFSKKIKWLMDAPDYRAIFPEARRDGSNDSLAEWSMVPAPGKQPGMFVCAGRGTGISGKGADILLIDDPIADAEEAESKTIKEGLWDWFTSTAYTRLAPGGGVLVIQTLWADDDLAGRLRQMAKDDPEADQYEVVLYPALAEQYEYQHRSTYQLVRTPTPLDETPDAIPAYHKPDDYRLLRSPGQALHPARYDEAKYNKVKRTLPPRWWNALYQQNPVPDDGEYFKAEWFRFMPLPPLPDRRHWTVNIAWDFAIGEKNHNDYTVGSVMLHTDNDDYLIVDVVRFRSGDAGTIAKAIADLAVKWYQPGTLLRIGAEDGQIWRAVSGPVRDEFVRRKLLHMLGAIEPLRPVTDKMARGRSLQGKMMTGGVYFVNPTGVRADAPAWYEPMRQELLRFPAGAHDDQVDSPAWNAIMLAGKTPPRPVKKKNEKSWRDKLKDLTRSAEAKSYMRA